MVQLFRHIRSKVQPYNASRTSRALDDVQERTLQDTILHVPLALPATY